MLRYLPYIVVALLMIGPLHAAELHLDPSRGETLERAVKRARPGDILRLLPGWHGNPEIAGSYDGTVLVVGMPGATVGRSRFRGAANWRFEKVDFRGETSMPGMRASLVEADPASSNLTFADCSFATAEDSTGWTERDWVDKPYRLALHLRGNRMRVTGSHFFNVRNALAIMADDSLVEGNRFEAFGNDAIEFGANRLRIVGNTIRDGRHSPAERLHADAIQGFPAPGDTSFSDIVIADNRIEASPRADYLQGITAFDGRWRNVVVRGNSVVTSAYHGITWFGVDGILIEGNQVVQEREGKITPWIEVAPSKEGRLSSDIVVRGNISPLVRIRP